MTSCVTMQTKLGRCVDCAEKILLSLSTLIALVALITGQVYTWPSLCYIPTALLSDFAQLHHIRTLCLLKL